jgi:hypothetical protein
MDLNKLKTKISITLCHILSEAAEGKYTDRTTPQLFLTGNILQQYHN